MADPELQVACRLVPGGWSCHVRLREDSSVAGASDFDVSVSEAELARYGADYSPEQLVSASFRFLLEREPAGSILRQFRLSQIEDYFPDFPAEVARQS